MSERVIVLGSNSFSGSHFVDFALARKLEVVGISRSPEPHAVFLPYKRRGNALFRFVQADLNHDLDQIMEVVTGFQPDYVVNFAAQGMVAESWHRPEDWFLTNTLANVKLHDRLRRCMFLKTYVHVSTPEVYGSCEGLVREHTCYNPTTPYAVSRAAADMSLMSFYRAYQFPVVFTRAANVYGPGQQLYRIIPRCILSFLTGRKLPLHGGGQSVRSFIHIRDVAEGTLRAARSGGRGEIYHFATAQNMTIRSLVETIGARLGVSFDDHVELVGERLGKDAAYLLDSSKAKQDLGWQANISLDAGLDETIRWVRENLAVLTNQPLTYIHKP